MNKETGGPAFPTLAVVGNLALSEGGISVRDYFAAKAMQGICVSEELRFTSAERIASMSYQIADAMLEERAK